MPSEYDRWPVPSVDYPRTLVESGEFFPDEAACRLFRERLRWPEEFGCPPCGRAGSAWRIERRLWLCAGCRRQTSVTAGTLFEKTRKPLRHWFLAGWEVTSQKYGASALVIQRVLGLRRDETAWAWLHKLRRAMVRPDRDRLANDVEVDEPYVGGEEAGVCGRATVSKAIVAIAAELTDGQIARDRLRHVPDVSGGSRVGFVTDVVASWSVVRTDGWKAYRGLTAKGFTHRVTVLSASPDPAYVLMPSVHRVAALLKR